MAFGNRPGQQRQQPHQPAISEKSAQAQVENGLGAVAPQIIGASAPERHHQCAFNLSQPLFAIMMHTVSDINSRLGGLSLGHVPLNIMMVAIAVLHPPRADSQNCFEYISLGRPFWNFFRKEFIPAINAGTPAVKIDTATIATFVSFLSIIYFNDSSKLLFSTAGLLVTYLFFSILYKSIFFSKTIVLISLNLDIFFSVVLNEQKSKICL